ncbi:LOW QUALITY PROTEIN: cilia- and flagella-associated protein 107 [Pungitius pungitius]|uniref:LOW QUALITY PROTEIN: cilia- and flagella-associated protein 107 n=1 Tax=Pungitius pungitius TaxID=134920 RepID=UPI002E0D3723
MIKILRLPSLAVFAVSIATELFSFPSTQVSTNQTGTAKDKWAQPGWRIEQKYSNKVLSGTWAEERRQFTRKPQTADCTSRVDHRPHWDFQPDVSERRSGRLRAEGLPSKLLFAHDRSPPSHYLVTHYGESYQRKRTNNRPWHPDSLTWQLERSERPISGKPVSGPPRSTKSLRLEKQQPIPSRTGRAQVGTPRGTHLSALEGSPATSTKPNHNNKDLDLRSQIIAGVHFPNHNKVAYELPRMLLGDFSVILVLLYSSSWVLST